MPTIVNNEAVCGLKMKIIERSTNEGSQDQGGAGYSGDGRGAV